MTVATGRLPVALPRVFYGWLGACAVSGFGDATLYFALGWVAAGIGPAWAGLVLTANTVPRAILLLLGGAVGDRWGPRRLLLIGSTVMCAVTVLLALSLRLWDDRAAILLVAALAIGIVDAFYLPATASFPRLLVNDTQLPRALSLGQSVAQLVRLMAAPVGGVLVAVAGLGVSAVVDAATFVVLLVALSAIRPPKQPPPLVGQSARGEHRTVLMDAAAGARVAVSDPLIRALLIEPPSLRAACCQ